MGGVSEDSSLPIRRQKKAKRRVPASFEQEREEWLRWQLRRLHYKWPRKAAALRLARVDRGKILCSGCHKIYHYKEVRIDHIHPVAGTSDRVSIQEFIERLFCDADGYQALCAACHQDKTNKEREARNLLKTKHDV